MSNLENHFKKFRKNTVGNEARFYSPFGKQTIVYGHWIASGRLYKPLEKRMLKDFGPYVANTHTETNVTGTLMTKSYHEAQNIIKKHCNAGPNDVLMHAGYGMTAVIVKLQRILGLKGCGPMNSKNCLKDREKPVVFITYGTSL